MNIIYVSFVACFYIFFPKPIAFYTFWSLLCPHRYRRYIFVSTDIVSAEVLIAASLKKINTYIQKDKNYTVVNLRRIILKVFWVKIKDDIYNRKNIWFFEIILDNNNILDLMFFYYSISICSFVQNHNLMVTYFTQ